MGHSRKQGKRLFLRLIAGIAMVAVMAGLLSQVVFARNSYIITDGSYVTTHRSYSTDPETILAEAGIELGEEDTYIASFSDGVSQITVHRIQQVTVVDRGTATMVGTYGEEVGSLLSRMGIELGEEDFLNCEEDNLTYDGMRIEIVNRRTEVIEAEESIPYESSRFEDTSLAPGEEVILVAGQNGTLHRKTEIIYENGVEVSRRDIEEAVTKEPVTELVLFGADRGIREQPEEPAVSTRPNNSTGTGSTSGDVAASGGIITTAGGQTYTYTDVLTCTATAYSCEGYTGITATGTVARVGAIAVDPTVIPYGTKMYVVSNDGKYVYGYCVAEDCGGGIKGNKIDLYFDTVDECWQFGRRTCTVYILAED